MATIKYRVHSGFYVKERDFMRENMQNLIDKIKKFYCLHEDIMSLEDKKDLLGMLLRMEQCKKYVPHSEKKLMYKNFRALEYKYISSR